MVVISRRRVLQSVPVARAVPCRRARQRQRRPRAIHSAGCAGPSLIGSSFTATSPTAIWPARLTAVEDLPASPGSDRRYALRFTSTTTPREGTYGLSRPAFATTQLHLVPGSGGRTWTAVVNRL